MNRRSFFGRLAAAAAGAALTAHLELGSLIPIPEAPASPAPWTVEWWALAKDIRPQALTFFPSDRRFHLIDAGQVEPIK